MNDFTEASLLAGVTAYISFTVSEMKIFSGLRDRASKLSPLLGGLLSCGYCLGHWIAFLLVFLYRPRLFDFWWPLDFFLTAILIAWLSGLQWVLMCWLMDRTGK